MQPYRPQSDSEMSIPPYVHTSILEDSKATFFTDKLKSDPTEERKVLYYSDFNIDVSAWREAKERLKIFSSTLVERLRKNFY